MNYYISFFRNYFNFSGRTTRAGYWVPQIINIFIVLNLFICALICMPSPNNQIPSLDPMDTLLTNSEYSTTPIWISYISLIFFLLTFIPSLSSTVRRLHDINRSGWWIFLNFLPLAGPIALFIYFCQESGNDNQYGPKPDKINFTV